MGYYARNPWERIEYIECEVCYRLIDPSDAEIVNGITSQGLRFQMDTCGDELCIEEARVEFDELIAKEANND